MSALNPGGKTVTPDPLDVLMAQWDAGPGVTVPEMLLPLHRHMAENLFRETLDAIAAAGLRVVAVDHEEVEYGRRFVDPDPGDVDVGVFPPHSAWGYAEFAKPAPSINGHPTEWVTRTVTYGPWVPVEPEDHTHDYRHARGAVTRPPGAPPSEDIVRAGREDDDESGHYQSTHGDSYPTEVEGPVEAAAKPKDKVVDLMTALEDSLAAAKAAHKRPITGEAPDAG